MSHLIEAVFIIGIDSVPSTVSVYTMFLSREERALSIDLAVLRAKGSGTK